MKFRAEHVQAFQEVRMPDFENFMVEHMKSFSPLHSQSLGDDGMRALIRFGVDRAKTVGFTHRAPVQFYIETMILLGAEFDTDPQYPAVGKMLRDPATSDQTQRANKVHAWLMQFLDAAGGPDRQFAQQALRRARALPLESTPVASPRFADEALRRLRANHPEKANYLGDAVLRGLIPRATEEARQYAVDTDNGVCLFVGLMFAVGHGFARDPKYPWVMNTLTNPSIKDRETRVERLYSKTMTYLDHVLQHLGGT